MPHVFKQKKNTQIYKKSGHFGIYGHTTLMWVTRNGTHDDVTKVTQNFIISIYFDCGLGVVHSATPTPLSKIKTVWCARRNYRNPTNGVALRNTQADFKYCRQYSSVSCFLPVHIVDNFEWFGLLIEGPEVLLVMFENVVQVPFQTRNVSVDEIVR